MKKKITAWTSFFKSKQGKRLFLIVLFAGLIVLPFVSNTLVKRIASTIFIYSLLSMGNMVIGGFTGMLNLGHAAFWGVGAYITAILMTAYNVPFTIAFLASGIGTALVGLLIAIPCLRLATDFLSLITIAFSYVFLAIVRNWMSVTKGPQGIPGISCINFFGIDFKDPIAIYFVLLAITVLSYIIISNITKSKFGRAMQATRDDELGARSAGIKPNQIKILSFVIGTFFAGLAGALYAAYIGYIGPNTFTFDTSTTIFQMCILGGLGSIPGAIVGTVFFVVMPEVIRTLAVYRVGVGGIIMLLLMLFRPQGIMGSRAFATKDGLQERLKNWLIARRVTKETAQRQE